MSLNKVRRIEDKNHIRDSFDDRVCDDLSEVILQYLSFKDKLRLESVSKQFQRTVLCKEETLFIDWRNVNELEAILKKLPALTAIYSQELEQQSNETIELIIKCCNHLIEFDSNLLSFVDKDIQIKFFEKFGRKLKSIRIVDYQRKRYLKRTPNIEELNDWSLNQNFSDIQFKRLKRLTLNLLLYMDLTQFEVFIERNAKTITHLEITCFPIFKKSNVEYSEVVFKMILTIISNLKKLIHLKIQTPFAINSFTEYFNQIAVNCNQLKSLSIDYELELTDGPNAEQFLALKLFKRLKRLELKFVNESNSLSNYLSNNGFFPFITLPKVVPNLTHLWFHFRDIFIGCQKLSDTIFTNIDINYPKLQFIYIFGINLNVIENTVLMMSRMTRFESILLYLSRNQNKTKIRSQLAQNCKKLRKIRLNIY